MCVDTSASLAIVNFAKAQPSCEIVLDPNIISNILGKITLMAQLHPIEQRWVNFCWNKDVKSEGKGRKWENGH